MSAIFDNFPAVPVERCECPRCESTVPAHFVFNRYDFEQSPPRRTLAIYCHHCEIFHEATFELRGGIWTPTGDVHVITHAKRLDALRQRVNEIGSIQLAQSA